MSTTFTDTEVYTAQIPDFSFIIPKHGRKLNLWHAILTLWLLGGEYSQLNNPELKEEMGSPQRGHEKILSSIYCE